MNFERDRLATFQRASWLKHKVPISDRRLSNAGFYYADGHDDTVQCFSCSGTVNGWLAADSAKGRHKREYPDCRFVRGEDGRNIPDVVLSESCTNRLNTRAAAKTSRATEMKRDVSRTTPGAQRNMSSEYRRLLTFKRWPLESPVDPYQLAASGFSCVGQTTVQCFACFGRISAWKLGDRPKEKHRRLFPSCPFVRGDETRNVPLTSDERLAAITHDIHQPPARTENSSLISRHPDFKTEESRHSTFLNWPLSHPIKPAKLSKAGFFYSNEGDLVTCFCCGARLDEWTLGDDPWVEHARLVPNCDWLLQQKGFEFVFAVNNDKQ